MSRETYMPRRGLQPWLRTVTVWLKDGSAFKTHALYTGKNVKDHVVLSREPSTHPAWTGQRTLVETEDGAYKQFQKKFGFDGGKKTASLIQQLGGAKKKTKPTKS